MRRIVCFMMLLALTIMARGQTAYSYRYWFDNDLATLQTGTANGETTIELDISSLAKGSVHAIHLQGIDARQKWSTVRTQYFYIANDFDTESATARYWYDNDETTVQTAPTVNGTIDLDVSQLAVGAHSVHYQTFNAVGEASPVHTQYFYIANEADTKSATARYWFDNDEMTVQTAPTVNGTIDLDVSHLTVGTHAVHYQTFNAAGGASPVRTQYFYMNELQRATLSCKIWIDNDKANAQTFALTDEDIVMEAEGLSVGMHDLHVVLYDSEGNCLDEKTVQFKVTVPVFTLVLKNAVETFSCDEDLDFQSVSGLKAFTAAGFDKYHNEVSMHRVNSVPAGTGLLLVGKAGTTYDVPLVKSFMVYANMLEPALEDTTIGDAADGYIDYVLSAENGENAFTRATDGTVLEAGRAYLRIPGSSGASSRLRIRFDTEPGDVNSDFTVDVADIATVISVMSGNAAVPSAAADVNGDGVVDVADIAAVISIMAANARMQQVAEE